MYVLCKLQGSLGPMGDRGEPGPQVGVNTVNNSKESQAYTLYGQCYRAYPFLSHNCIHIICTNNISKDSLDFCPFIALIRPTYAREVNQNLRCRFETSMCNNSFSMVVKMNPIQQAQICYRQITNPYTEQAIMPETDTRGARWTTETH